MKAECAHCADILCEVKVRMCGGKGRYVCVEEEVCVELLFVWRFVWS